MKLRIPRIQVSVQPRDCHFFGRLRSFLNYEQWLRAAYCGPLRKAYVYVYVPWLQRQLSLDVWL